MNQNAFVCFFLFPASQKHSGMKFRYFSVVTHLFFSRNSFIFFSRNSFMRAMLGITRLDRVRNEEIANRTRLPRVTELAWKRKVKWATKVANADVRKWSRRMQCIMGLCNLSKRSKIPPKTLFK